METLFWVFLLSLAGAVFIVTIAIAGEGKEYKKFIDRKTGKLDLLLVRWFDLAVELVVGKGRYGEKIDK